MTNSGRIIREVLNDEAKVAETKSVESATGTETVSEEVYPELTETGSYSVAQVAAIAYDRPERVPLGSAPEVARYRLLCVVAWILLGFAIMIGVWRLYASAHTEVPSITTQVVGSITPILSALLNFLGLALLGILVTMAAHYIARLDAQASWITWRSAALTEPLRESDVNLPFILPWSVSGGLLIGLGLVVATGAAPFGDTILQAFGGGVAITAAGLLLALLGAGSGEASRFLWRMSQFGKALAARKRGDEIGLLPPSRVQAFTKTSSTGLMLLTLAFLTASFATFIWLMCERLKMAADIALLIGGFLGIVGGAYTLYRLTTLWSDMLYGWEYGARSIGKSHSRYPGELATNAFRAAGWTVSFCIVVLIVPVVKTIGNTNVPMLLMSIFLPVSSILFILWLVALKRDSFKLALATSVVAGSRSWTVRSNLWPRLLAGALMLVVVLEGLWIFYDVFMSLNQSWRGSIATRGGADKEAAKQLLLATVFFGLIVLSGFWAALTLLDMDRANANLEVCNESL
ncbi:MAG: hypothetical protein V1899_00280 [Planctomycetota bacterium]